MNDNPGPDLLRGRCAYAAGLALIGASHFTAPRPLPQEHAHFLLRHAHF